MFIGRRGALSDVSRQLLQAMPLTGQEGGTVSNCAISGLEGDAIWSAISQLVSRSLLETRDRLGKRRYGIHRLTETFLNTDINFGIRKNRCFDEANASQPCFHT